MFGSLTSLTGGGGLSSSSSSEAGGDAAFDNTFNYKTNEAPAVNTQVVLLGAVAVVAVLFLSRRK